MDDGRCPTQHVVQIAETVSSGGSSLTSQPQRPSSSSSSVARYNKYPGATGGSSCTGMNMNHTNNKSGNRITAAMVPTSPSGGGGGGKGYSHSIVSESSVIFQKSVGLSKLLAPSSPRGGGQQQEQQQQTSQQVDNKTRDESYT